MLCNDCADTLDRVVRKCDLVLNNGLAIHNSFLIKQYLDADKTNKVLIPSIFTCATLYMCNDTKTHTYKFIINAVIKLLYE